MLRNLVIRLSATALCVTLVNPLHTRAEQWASPRPTAEYLFKVLCFGCHGRSPSPVEHPATDFRDGRFELGDSVDEVARSIREGTGTGRMPGWGRGLAERDIQVLARYVRSLSKAHPQ